jgi:hypothetical protein
MGEGPHAREDALDIAIDDRHRLIETNRTDGSSRITADARERLPLLRCGRPSSGSVFYDQASGFLESARAGVIAQAGPKSKELVERCAGDRLQVGEFGHPA